MEARTLISDLSFRDSDHTYWAGERELASVTRVLDATGMKPKFYKSLDPSYRQRGTAAHLACFLVGLGEYDEESTHPEIRPFARQFATFMEETGFKPLTMECGFAVPDLGVAGRRDMDGLDKHSEPWALDLKTGSMPPDIYVATQLAGYDHTLIDGVRIYGEDEDPLQLNWLQKFVRDNKKARFRRKCLNLPGGDAARGTLKSFDEPRWATVWRSCLNNFNIRREYGQL
jgi:hypothetical protein